MKINKTYRLRIYPNEKQAEKLANCFGACRFVYNYFLNERKTQYEKTGKSDNYYVQKRKLAVLKNESGYEWLYETSSQSLQVAVNQVETAYTNFFSKRSRFPRFHSRKSRQSFTITQGICIENNKLYIPKFKIPFKIKIHRPINGIIKFGSIVKYPSNKYYINITIEEEIRQINKKTKNLGIDLGIKDLLITSNGIKYQNHKYINQYAKELKKAQQHLSRKIKGSRGSESQRIKVAKIQEKISNCRKDNLHKISYSLTKNYSDIFIEDLRVKQMQKDKRLAKYIQDCSWSTFVNMLEYKGNWYGCKIHKIERYYPSSKTCSNCNYTLETLDLKDRSWTCPKCGTKHDRDINAAKNILNEGLRELSAGTVDYTGREKIRLHSYTKKQISMKPEVHVSLDRE